MMATFASSGIAQRFSALQGDPSNAESAVRRAIHFRASQVHGGVRRLLLSRPSRMGPRLLARRRESARDHARSEHARLASRWIERVRDRRPRAVQVPGDLHDRGGILVRSEKEVATLRKYLAQRAAFSFSTIHAMASARATGDGRTSTRTFKRIFPGRTSRDLDRAPDLPLVLRHRVVRHRTSVL